MGEVIHIFRRGAHEPTGGVIHIWDRDEDGSFLIGQESASGNSWGHFSSHASASEAVAAAYDLRDELYRDCDGYRCEIFIPPVVLARLAEEDGDASPAA